MYSMWCRYLSLDPFQNHSKTTLYMTFILRSLLLLPLFLPAKISKIGVPRWLSWLCISSLDLSSGLDPQGHDLRLHIGLHTQCGVYFKTKQKKKKKKKILKLNLKRRLRRISQRYRRKTRRNSIPERKPRKESVIKERKV